jgi:hypothetical protein
VSGEGNWTTLVANLMGPAQAIWSIGIDKIPGGKATRRSRQ